MSLVDVSCVRMVSGNVVSVPGVVSIEIQVWTADKEHIVAIVYQMVFVRVRTIDNRHRIIVGDKIILGMLDKNPVIVVFVRM